MLRQVPRIESTPPLFYVVAWGWTRLFGFGEMGLRSLSAIAGVATVPLAYAAGARLATRRVGLVAAALAATSPILVWYSQEARSYALFVAVTTLALVCCLRALARPSRGRLAAWALAAAAALATHYFAVFAVVPQAVWLLWATRRPRPSALPVDRDAAAAVGAVALAGVALLTLAIQQQHRGLTAWIAGIPLGHRIAELPRELIAGFPPAGRPWLPWAGVAILLGALALLARRADVRERRAAARAAPLAAVAVGAPLVFAAVGLDYFLARNVLVAWLPLALLVAAVLGARRAGWVGTAATAGLCAVGLVSVALVATTPTLQRPAWRDLAAMIGPTTPGRAIELRGYVSALPLAIQRQGTWLLPARGAPVRELDVVNVDTHAAPACWWGATCNIPRTLPSSRPPVTGFALASRTSGHGFTVTRFRAPVAIRVRPAQLDVAHSHRRGNVTLLDGLRTPWGSTPPPPGPSRTVGVP